MRQLARSEQRLSARRFWHLSRPAWRPTRCTLTDRCFLGTIDDYASFIADEPSKLMPSPLGTSHSVAPFASRTCSIARPQFIRSIPRAHRRWCDPPPRGRRRPHAHWHCRGVQHSWHPTSSELVPPRMLALDGRCIRSMPPPTDMFAARCGGGLESLSSGCGGVDRP